MSSFREIYKYHYPGDEDPRRIVTWFDFDLGVWTSKHFKSESEAREFISLITSDISTPRLYKLEEIEI